MDVLLSKIFIKTILLEMLMDGCSFFSKTPIDASGWMKKCHREMSNPSKVILVPNNWSTRVVLVINALFFKKIFLREKKHFSVSTLILRCQCSDF